MIKTPRLVKKLKDEKGRRKKERRFEGNASDGALAGLSMESTMLNSENRIVPFDRTLNASSIDNTCYTGAAIINYPRARREIAILLDNVTELEHAKITVGFLFAARPLTSSVFFKSRFHSLF